MSKHKRLHNIVGKGKFSKFAGFVSSHYGLPSKKKAAPDATNIQSGKAEQSLPDTVSASYDTKETEELQA